MNHLPGRPSFKSSSKLPKPNMRKHSGTAPIAYCRSDHALICVAQLWAQVQDSDCGSFLSIYFVIVLLISLSRAASVNRSAWRQGQLPSWGSVAVEPLQQKR